MPPAFFACPHDPDGGAAAPGLEQPMLRGILTVGGWTMASRILGFARDILIAALLGAGPVADAFFLANRLPNLFRRLFGEGAFNAAFVPGFAGLLATEGPEAARRFAEQAIAVMAFWLFGLTILAEIFMPQLMGVCGARLHRRSGEIRAGGGTGADHVPLHAADLPDRAAVGRAERARPLRRRRRRAGDLQRGLDRLHAGPAGHRADGRARRGLGRQRLRGRADRPALLGGQPRRHAAHGCRGRG